MSEKNFNTLINSNLGPYLKKFLEVHGNDPKSVALSEKEIDRIYKSIFSWSSNTLETVLWKMNLKIADALEEAPDTLRYPFWNDDVGYNNLRWNVRLNLNKYAIDNNISTSQLIDRMVNVGIKSDVAQKIWEGERNIRNYESDRLAELFQYGDGFEYDFYLETEDDKSL